MKGLAETPPEHFPGFFLCGVCGVSAGLRGEPFPLQWEKWAQFRKSNGEIRVSRLGTIYAAPILIAHYIEEHGYCPPAGFLSAIEEAPIQLPEPMAGLAPGHGSS